MWHPFLAAALLLPGLLLAGPAAAQHDGHSAGLDREVEAVRAATARYRDHRAAVADGYRRFGRESALMGEHWYREDLVRRPLELARPSTLQYATVGGERVLVGVAYTVYQRPGEPVPEGFAGAGDRWHVHDVVRLARTLTRDRPVARWLAERRIRNGRMGAGEGRTRLTMVHAWVWLDNPGGTFAMQHPVLPYLRAGLPASWGSSVDAAMGVALLDPATCGQEVGRVRLLARPGRRVERAVRRECESAAMLVRRAPRSDRDRLNAVAAGSWAAFERARDRLLTAEQRERLAAAVEHDMTGH